MIEVELRGFLTESEFKLKLNELRDRSVSFEEDHRDTVFFMIPGATLKVSRMRSKGRAKVAYKTGDIVASTGQAEIEIDIPIEAHEQAVAMFQLLGFTDVQLTEQIRYNITVDDFEVAMKWSKDWGYHFEVEKVVADSSRINAARAELEEFCACNGLKFMTEEEFEKFRQEIDAQHRELLI